MKRVLGLVLALAVMVGMSTMPSFGQDKGKKEAKKGAPAAEKKGGKEGDAKKAEKGKEESKAAKKGDGKKKADK
jgi:hypothetical protein